MLVNSNQRLGPQMKHLPLPVPALLSIKLELLILFCGRGVKPLCGGICFIPDV